MVNTLMGWFWRISGKSSLIRFLYALVSNNELNINFLYNAIKNTTTLRESEFNLDNKKILIDIYKYGIDIEEYSSFDFKGLDENEKMNT